MRVALPLLAAVLVGVVSGLQKAPAASTYPFPTQAGGTVPPPYTRPGASYGGQPQAAKDTLAPRFAEKKAPASTYPFPTQAGGTVPPPYTRPGASYGGQPQAAKEH